jgi:hypothetical protein
LIESFRADERGAVRPEMLEKEKSNGNDAGDRMQLAKKKLCSVGRSLSRGHERSEPSCGTKVRAGISSLHAPQREQN